MIGFIEEHRGVFGVEPICRVPLASIPPTEAEHACYANHEHSIEPPDR